MIPKPMISISVKIAEKKNGLNAQGVSDYVDMVLYK